MRSRIFISKAMIGLCQARKSWYRLEVKGRTSDTGPGIVGGKNLRIETVGSSPETPAFLLLTHFQSVSNRSAVHIKGRIGSRLASNGGNTRFDIYFDQREVPFNRGALTAEQFDAIAVQLSGEDRNPPIEIVGGMARLTINSSITKEFSIPAQTNGLQTTATSREKNGEFVPWHLP